MTLKSNQDLFDYLKSLSARLADWGYKDLSQRILHASLFVNGSPSEFLHESRHALSHVRSMNIPELSENDKNEMRASIEAIETAFRSVGDTLI
jgi:hypothetical protein